MSSFDEISRTKRKSDASNSAFFAGLTAFLSASAFAGLFHYAATRTLSSYRLLHPQPKTFFVTSFVVAITIINAERAQLGKIDEFRDTLEEKRIQELKKSLG
jgi:hypothetical protein